MVPLNRMVLFFAESGNVYQTGLNSNNAMFDYVALENESPGELAYRRTPKQIDFSNFSEKIVSVSADEDENRVYIIGETGKVYGLSGGEYKEVTLPEKITDAWSTGAESLFLSKTNKLYSLKDGEEISKVAENVSFVATDSNNASYYISSGEAFGKGHMSPWLGTEANKNEIDYKVIDTFEKLDIPEKVLYITEYAASNTVGYGNRIAFVGESGKVYALKKVQDSSKRLLEFCIIENVYTIENIEAVQKITDIQIPFYSKENGSKYEYAVKLTGEEWKVCYAVEADGLSRGECVALYDTPEWKQ